MIVSHEAFCMVQFYKAMSMIEVAVVRSTFLSLTLHFYEALYGLGSAKKCVTTWAATLRRPFHSLGCNFMKQFL